MGERDREQAKNRGNTDVVHDERGRGSEVGRGPYQETAEQRNDDPELDEREADDEGSDPAFRESHEKYTAGLNHDSALGGKKGRAERHVRQSGEKEKPR